MNKKLLNTQIEALNKEHGAIICQFYKDNGFDILSLTGSNNIESGALNRYYGVNSNGIFTHRVYNDFISIKTITLEEAKELVKEKYTIKDLAEGKIAIRYISGNIELLQKVLRLAFPNSKIRAQGNARYYFKYHNTDSWIANNNNIDTMICVDLEDIIIEEEKSFPRVMLVSNQNNIKDSHRRVVFAHKCDNYIAWNDAKTLEEAEKKTNTTSWKYSWELEEKSRFPFELKADDAQSIINIACSGWKADLADRWGKNIVLNEVITIEEQFYKSMRNACTAVQSELFDKIFGKD